MEILNIYSFSHKSHIYFNKNDPSKDLTNRKIELLYVILYKRFVIDRINLP